MYRSASSFPPSLAGGATGEEGGAGTRRTTFNERERREKGKGKKSPSPKYISRSIKHM
jgi:hypothetical protein